MKHFTAQTSFSVLIPDGDKRFALLVLPCLAKVKNLKVYVLANDPYAPIRFSRYITKFFTYDKTIDEQGYLEAIINTAKTVKADLILPVDEEAIRLLAENKGKIDNVAALAPQPDLEAFDALHNKWRLAKTLIENNIPAPATILYENTEQFAINLSKFTFPVLLKPTHRRGGQGIKIFNNSQDLLDFAKKHISSEEYIIQSFTKGYDVDCNVLCQHGKILAYSIQKEFMPGYNRFEPPSCVDFIDDSMVYNAVKD